MDAEGRPRREPLSGCWNVAFERVAAVRGFASFRGQRNRPGLWWFATTGEHVGHESWLERDRLMALDADPEVVGVAAQPMWLRWAAESGRLVRHAPDYFARRADGTGVVIDVRPDQRIGEQDAGVFAAAVRLCAQVGWEYQRVGELGAVHAANLRWLAGYRHPGSLSWSWRPGWERCSPTGRRCWAGRPRRGIRWRCCRCCSGCCGGAS